MLYNQNVFCNTMLSLPLARRACNIPHHHKALDEIQPRKSKYIEILYQFDGSKSDYIVEVDQN